MGKATPISSLLPPLEPCTAPADAKLIELCSKLAVNDAARAADTLCTIGDCSDAAIQHSVALGHEQTGLLLEIFARAGVLDQQRGNVGFFFDKPLDPPHVTWAQGIDPVKQQNEELLILFGAFIAVIAAAVLATKLWNGIGGASGVAARWQFVIDHRISKSVLLDLRRAAIIAAGVFLGLAAWAWWR